MNLNILLGHLRKRKKMHYNRNSKSFSSYDANYSHYFGNYSVIDNLFTCDVNYPVHVINCGVSVTSSTLKVFVKF